MAKEDIELSSETSPVHQSEQAVAKPVGYLTDERLDHIEELLDQRFKLPVIGLPIGLDGIIGLIPGVGDVLTTTLSLGIVAEGWKRGVSRTTLIRMLMNVGIDFVVGAVPLVGDIFDFAFKANVKNIRLIREDAAR